MAIEDKWLGRGLYLEYWVGIVTSADVKKSAERRQQWKAQDGDGHYCVLIDLSKCATLPPPVSLKLSAKIHPRDKVTFYLCAAQTMYYSVIGNLIAITTGYSIKSVDTYELGLAAARATLQMVTAEHPALSETEPVKVGQDAEKPAEVSAIAAPEKANNAVNTVARKYPHGGGW